MELFNQYQNLKEDVLEISQKITDLEQEKVEHKFIYIVLFTLITGWL
jgi:hypothetical protein